MTYPDGTPLTTGAVAFSTPTFQAEGRLNSKGEYQLGSLETDDGLPPGNYKVYVIGAQFVDGNEQTIYLIDPILTSAGTTPLSYDVKSGIRKFDFTVEYPTKAKKAK